MPGIPSGKRGNWDENFKNLLIYRMLCFVCVCFVSALERSMSYTYEDVGRFRNPSALECYSLTASQISNIHAK